METTIDKQSFGEAGCVHVANGFAIPQGQYCAFTAVTDIITPAFTIGQAPLTGTVEAPTVSTIASRSYPAGFTVFTSIISPSGGISSLTGDAIFYRAL